MSNEFSLSLYRFDPEKDERPYMSDYKISYPETGNMMVSMQLDKHKKKTQQSHSEGLVPRVFVDQMV